MRTILFILLFTVAAAIWGIANAATYTIEKYEDNSTYIQSSGETVKGDDFKLKIMLSTARLGENFSNVIHLSGPGGAMVPGIEVARTIRMEGLDTRSEEECASACSLQWLAGVNRSLEGEEAQLGFHFPYTDDTKALDNVMELYGWFGIQANINGGSAHFIAYMLFFGMDDDYWILHKISQLKSPGDIFWVTPDTISLLGEKGRIHDEDS